MKHTFDSVFETVMKHIIKQGKPSMTMINGELSCAYRGVEGRSCAIGCLIPNNEYNPNMEGKRFSTIIRNKDKNIDGEGYFALPTLWAIIRDLEEQIEPKIGKIESRAKVRNFFERLQVLHDNYLVSKEEYTYQFDNPFTREVFSFVSLDVLHNMKELGLRDYPFPNK